MDTCLLLSHEIMSQESQRGIKVSSILKKVTVAVISAGLISSIASVPALAYPVGSDTQIVLSKTSAIRSGTFIKVKAQGVNRDCEVEFVVAGRNTDNEDYDIASAFAGKNYSTAYTALYVPETPGEYEVQANYEPSCQITGSHGKQSRAAFMVGKVTSLTTPTFTTSKLVMSASPLLQFSGYLNAKSTLNQANPSGVAGQNVTVVVTVSAPGKADKLYPAQALKTDANGLYAGKLQLKKTDVKGSYKVTTTFTGDKVYSKPEPATSASVSIATLKAKFLAANAAKFAAGARKAEIAKLTR